MKKKDDILINKFIGIEEGKYENCESWEFLMYVIDYIHALDKDTSGCPRYR